MYRKFYDELLNWKKDSKMPLMLAGAKQTGKTYILNEFCKQNYDNFIYINLEQETNITEIFENTLTPEEIIEKIEIIKK